MKLTLQHLILRFMAAVMAIGWGLTGASCTDPETTDSTKFAIFYAGLTDIGPSMSFTLDGPSYIGAAPSDFAITQVKRNGEPVETSCFTISATTGAITLENTSSLAVGLYTLSISCNSNGNYYEFKDIVSIHMMNVVPEGISVTPEKLQVNFADVVDEQSDVELPTAQVTTQGNHISIRKYLIANVRRDGTLVEKNDFFTISNSGLISIVRGKSSLKPGKYVIDLKLTTAAVDEESEEGLFVDALEIDVTSGPLSLTYAPNNAKVEEHNAFTSVAPLLEGSTDGLTYSIASIVPETSEIHIDPATGVLSIAEGNQLPIGGSYSVSVKATNAYGSKEFAAAYQVDVVAYIRPITTLAYDDKEEIIQASAFEIPVKTVDGDEVTYSFVNLDEKLADLTIDAHTGTVSAKQGNTIPLGEYTVTVQAKNVKSEQQASFKLTIVKNPYYFTYIHWGNNLGLTPAKSYASQYRVTSQANLLALSIPVAETDLPEGVEVEWSVVKGSSSVTTVAIDEAGTVTFTGGWTNAKVLVVLIQATTGKGTVGETVVRTPIFIHCSAAVDGVTVNYTPFVFQVNPKTGGSSVAPEITGLSDLSLFKSDYRRTFNYYNINGPKQHKSGQPSATATDNFMSILWQAYYASIGVAAPNYGQKWPLSYYDNITKATGLSAPLAYVDNANGCAVKVNPNKWLDDNGYANGVMIGQITFVKDGNEANVSSGKQMFPIALWFDTKF